LLVAIVARAVISWFPINPRSPLVRILNEITEPVLAPLRRIVPQLGMVDITPMIAMLVLVFIQRAISQAG
jgi:YggT family protein